MSGKIVRRGHVCDSPAAANHTTGTVWECDCGQSWYRNQFGRWITIGLLDRILLNMNDAMIKSRKAGA